MVRLKQSLPWQVSWNTLATDYFAHMSPPQSACNDILGSNVEMFINIFSLDMKPFRFNVVLTLK
jgi:hypothetical protein